MRKFVIVIVVLFFCSGWYLYLYYPQQVMPIALEVEVDTPNYFKYHNDCLHPCIRKLDNGSYAMVQSPYYGWNNKVENPIYYTSSDYMRWKNGLLVADTPKYGFNSDPNLYIDRRDTIILWREGFTPLCDSLQTSYVTVGVHFRRPESITRKTVFVVNDKINGDIEQCPILICHNDRYYLYAAWYQYEPTRENLGIAIWECSNLNEPDFKLIDTIRLNPIYTVDKCAQIKIGGHLFFVPKPLKHDLWHFDLFEYNKKLYMVSVAEKGDNIMLSVSDDYKHFKTFQKPLINNHYSENTVHYRQYYYKPTAFVENDTLYLFYTANSKSDSKLNQMFCSKAKMSDVLK